MRIKKDDTVQIITGKDKGKTGRVIKVLPSRSRIVVEGLNMVSKHQRPSQENQQGGVIKKEASIHVSNVMLFYKNKTTRVAFKVLDSGKKVRFSKKHKGNID
ncbi:MAG: 50S ribosomal protein L24 [Candidatus Marinimicrobia bacterium]|nr:50S ribosomal protein L24 [Candidatus Neomarinimicrobiota bacterium]